MVDPAHRKNQLLQLICLIGLLRAKKLGYRHVNGAVVVGSRWLSALEKLGLQRAGDIVESKNEPVYPLCCHFDQSAVDFDLLLDALCTRLFSHQLAAFPDQIWLAINRGQPI